MGKAHVSHSAAGRASLRRQRFEDFTLDPPHDAASFFFDLKLMLPEGMTAADVHRARQSVERRLLRTVRKKDRIVWTAEGFFLLIATTDPARAGAAAERIHQDLCAVLGARDAAPADKAVHPVDPDDGLRPPPRPAKRKAPPRAPSAYDQPSEP